MRPHRRVDVLRGPVQLAYAVTDVHAAARRWVERGTGPFFVLEHIPLQNVRVEGVPSAFDHSSAYGQWGEVMVELICQHEGGTRPLVPTSGLHHVAFFVDDFAAAGRELAGRGMPEALYAETSTGMPFAFHDGRDELGHYVEIYERRPSIEGFYEMVRSTAVGWDGSDPIRVIR